MGETEKEMKCSDVTLPYDNRCCEYVPPAITYVQVRKDKNENWFVRINGEGQWIGATLIRGTNTLQFSY